MPTIKIHELPEKTYPELNPSDLMVVEDKADTKKITLANLKLLFSSDDKLTAFAEQYEKYISELRKLIESIANMVSTKDEDLEARLNNLFEDHERTKAKLGKLVEDMVDAQNHITAIEGQIKTILSDIKDIQKSLSDNDTRITALEKDNTTNKKNISDLQKDNTTNKKNISDLQTAVSSLDRKVDNEVDRLDKKIDAASIDACAYADGLYDKIIEYIDYYHHIHFNPPNFDEPYKGDPMVANYIHPVGTIFETREKDFDINEWFPGTWKYIGEGASFDKDGNRVCDYYTYQRIE